MNRKLIKPLLILKFIILSTILISFYQNCSQSKLHFGIADLTKPGPNDCLFSGKVVKDMNSVQAFLESSVPLGGTCQMQTRECHNSILDGKYQYPECNVGVPRVCILGETIINHGGSIIAYSQSSVNAGLSCDSFKQIRTCNDGTLSNSNQFIHTSCRTLSEIPNIIGYNGRIEGKIRNAVNGSLINGAQIQLISGSGQVINTYTTNQTGTYQFNNLSDGNYKISISASGYIPTGNLSATIQGQNNLTFDKSLSPVLSHNQIRIVTNWTGPIANGVKDVDSYLLLPGGNSNSNLIYFMSKNLEEAALDIDHVSWNGPETITISNLKSGTYRFYVHNYTNCSLTDLSNSNVQIDVYFGNNEPLHYKVPTGGSGTIYEVFQIVDGTIVPINQYSKTLYVSRICN